MSSKKIEFIVDDNELSLEKNIVTINIPLLFTCIDDNRQKYLVLCFDDENLKYLIAKTTNSDLINMLNSRIDMREPFKKSQQLWIVESSFDIEDDEVLNVKYNEVSEDILPRAGAYLELKNPSIEEYIRELERECGFYSEDIFIQQDKFMVYKINTRCISPKKLRQKIRSHLTVENDFSLSIFQISTKLNKFTL